MISRFTAAIGTAFFLYGTIFADGRTDSWAGAAAMFGLAAFLAVRDA